MIAEKREKTPKNPTVRFEEEADQSSLRVRICCKIRRRFGPNFWAFIGPELEEEIYFSQHKSNANLFP